MYKGKNIGSKGREGSFQVKQHPTGTIGSADDIIFSTEPGVKDNSQGFGVGDCWYSLGVGLVMGREGISDEMGELPMGMYSILVVLGSSFKSLDQLVLMFREFWTHYFLNAF